jgi:hypothetical protein
MPRLQGPEREDLNDGEVGVTATNKALVTAIMLMIATGLLRHLRPAV